MREGPIRLLVSAGEASGDHMLALVLRAMGSRVSAAGLCGPAAREVGATCLQDLGSTAVMGLAQALPKLCALRRLCHRLALHAADTRADAALLVGFTTFHERLGALLKRARIPVLWCAAPQVWAWRPSRLTTLQASLDRLAVILPFEEQLWRAHAYAVRYVGHPAVEGTRMQVVAPHEVDEPRLAVLCGSRAQEVHGTGRMLLEAAALWLDRHPRWGADVLIAQALPARHREQLRARARTLGLRPLDTAAIAGAAPRLHAYSIAFCVSGTASLESALAGTPPVVAYRCDPVTATVAQLLLRTRFVALPNVLLNRPAFPELLQSQATARSVVRAAETLCRAWDAAVRCCGQVRAILAMQDGIGFGDRVAKEVDALLPAS